MRPALDDIAVVFRALVDLVVPRTCATCHDRIPSGVPGRFCASCLLTIEDMAIGAACASCALPLTGSRCRRCFSRKGRGALFTRASAFGPFEGLLRRAIHAFKFGGDSAAGAQLGAMLGRAARRLPDDADLVVPVPLHFSRLLLRRYNQSAVLAREVSRAIGKPLVLDALARTRPGAEQSGSSRGMRRENVRGAFAARADRVAGRTVVLVDDVLTTGSTARACEAALREAGATRVYVAALARATEASDAW